MMSHILKRIAIAGGGKGSKKPKPPTYKPPILGELQYGASYSYAETIDLISDGPIGGLVNNKGQVVGGNTQGGIFQGIYLDDTPIAVSANDAKVLVNGQLVDSLNRSQHGTLSLSEGVSAAARKCGDFFAALEDAGKRDNAAKAMLSNLRQFGDIHRVSSEHGLERNPNGGEANLWYYTQRSSKGNGFVINPNGDKVFWHPRPGSNDNYRKKNVWFRALMRNDALGYWYQFYLGSKTVDGEFIPRRGSDIHSTPAFPDATALGYGESQTSSYHNHLTPQSLQDSLFWTDGGNTSTLDESRFMFGILGMPKEGPNSYGTIQREYRWLGGVGTEVRNPAFLRSYGGLPWGLFSKTGIYAEQFCETELNAIKKLFFDNASPNGNQYQKHLAEKALKNLRYDFDTPNERSIERRLLGDGLSQEDLRKRFFVIIKPENIQPSLSFSLADPDAENGMVPYRSYLRSSTSANGWLLENEFFNIGDGEGFIEVTDCTCPTIDENGILTGEMRGFYMLRFPDTFRGPTTLNFYNPEKDKTVPWAYALTGWLDSSRRAILQKISNLTYGPQDRTTQAQNRFVENYLFNYTNVLAEARNGWESQGLLEYFKDVFIDKIYNTDLFGPFAKSDSPEGSTDGTPERLTLRKEMFRRDSVFADDTTTAFNLEIEQGLPLNEGSDDERKIITTRTDEDGAEVEVESERNYSEWGNGALADWNEAAISVVHTVHNPNVKSVFITLGINSLKDTAHKEVAEVDGANGNLDKTGKLDVGSSFPAPLNIQVEVGVVSKEGKNKPTNASKFRIIALIESTTLVDIGNPDVQYDTNKKLVMGVGGEGVRSKTNVPFILPNPEEEGGARYVRVTKLSYETNSVLIHKDVTLNKVTEIIPVSLPYPFSAVVATKLDSRAFGAIPERTFDCKLKLVRVPSNYFPAGGGIYPQQNDKRYYRNSSELALTPQASKLVYNGDWDGTFKEELEWTDNPAWILYDLLTNKRYGLGNHVNEDNINKWELYKIARFCDAVDDEGYFVGVPNGIGGLEPRFSCNIVFEQGEKIYDAISTIAGIFRGKVFFSNSDVNFIDDRPRTPTNLFTNENVKEGLFHYSNNRRDEQFNTIEVSYKDRFDNFSPKVEIVEDEEDITRRGIFKKTIEGVGITSRAMARRVGQHVIFSHLRENQFVAFNAGLESLLCKPGELIIIEDDLKTNKANFGKILAIDPVNETIRVSNAFVEESMTGRLTVYEPTGEDSINEMDSTARLRRHRYFTFDLCPTGSPNSDFNNYFSGNYGFSGYTEGYTLTGGEGAEDGDVRSEEYALYTGTGTAPKNVVYFQTGFTGWMFATGEDYTTQSGMFIASGTTGTQNLSQLKYIYNYDDGSGDGRGASYFDASGVFVGGDVTDGALLSEIDAMSPTQTTVLSITGAITSDPTIQGSLLSGVDKPYVLPFLKLGSASKFEIKDASPFIYKVTSIKEENPNEYLVSASKYETGKYKLIEEDISIENKANTFSYQVGTTVNGITYNNLATPTITSLTTGLGATADTFFISGDWHDPNGANSTGYNVILTYPNFETEETTVTESGIKFDNQSTVGIFNVSVNALAKRAAARGNAYFDSQYTSSGIFVVYEDLLEFPQSFLQGLTILR